MSGGSSRHRKGSSQGQAYLAALQAGCIGLLPGVGQEADFLLQLGLTPLRGRSAGVGDLLGGQAAVQAEEAELHRAGPRVLQLQGQQERENRAAGAAWRGLCSPESKTGRDAALC